MRSIAELDAEIARLKAEIARVERERVELLVGYPIQAPCPKCGNYHAGAVNVLAEMFPPTSRKV